jgi:short-subunit dehydrogenase
MSAKRVALITGASRGLGYEMALALQKSGNYIVYGGVRKINSKEKDKFPFKQIILDVTKLDTIKNAVNEIINESKQLDILINNAGIGGTTSSIENCDIKIFRQVMEVNYFGLVQTTKECLQYLIKSKNGYIINISSIIGLCSFPFFSAYAATKGAVDRFTESLAVELSDTNVKVANISPGPSQTGFFISMEDTSKKQDPRYAKMFQNMFAKFPDFTKNFDVPPNEVGKCAFELIEGKITNEHRVFPGKSRDAITPILDNQNPNKNGNIQFGLNLIS